jgi:hypothetical protein
MTELGRLKSPFSSVSSIGTSGAGSAYCIGVPRALVPPDPRMAMPDFTYSNATICETVATALEGWAG